MPSIKPAAEDLPAREPVWQALSDLFLDTDTSTSRAWRCEELSRSPYSIDEIEFILVKEVYPVCRSNLRSAAGVWTGFDADWLRANILRRQSLPLRLLSLLSPAGFMVGRLTEWQATRRAVITARNAEGFDSAGG